MPKYHVARSIHINASPESVFDVVADFGLWTTWSPWHCAEPDAEVVVSADASSVGSNYKWNGELIGQGEIEHVKLERGRFIEEELRFLKPFKSIARVEFELAAAGDGTEITWHMYGSLPWFLFWMKSMMEPYIGMDYQRGLKMLKEKIETGEVLSKTTIRGVESIGPVKMVGKRKACAMADLGSSMESALKAVGKGCADAGITLEGEGMSAYHKWDMKAQTCEYTTGWAVDKSVQVEGNDLESWSIDATKALCVEHTGRYEHLGNAWSAAHQYLRYKKLKLAKVAAFEIYQNDPAETPPGELKTVIYLPLR